MAFGDGTFRSRAASLLHPYTYATNQSQVSNGNHEKSSKPSAEIVLDEKRFLDPAQSLQSGLERTQTASCGGPTHHSSRPNAAAHDREAQRIVRTIPAWVHTLDEDDEDLVAATRSLPHIPPEIRLSRTNEFPPSRFRFSRVPSPGRKFDKQREWTPPVPSRTDKATGSRWRAFADASAYPVSPAEGRELVNEEWLAQYGADYSRPWLADDNDDGDPEKGSARMHMFKAKRRAWYVRVQRTVLRNPIVPMVIRMNVWCYSAVALCLAASIHHLTDNQDNEAKQTPSTDMAIIVDAVAMIYLLYITYDEYSGKPLGLRPARAKIRLIFLDLFFIVFDSANLSLAFEAIRGPICSDTTHNAGGICRRQKGLASVLLIALIAWLLTFSISVMRLIERVTGR